MALSNPQEGLKANKERWEGYLTKILRKDMKPEYDRIAVKAVVTLISNWRTHRGGLLHEGIVPSHAAYYFVGFWAWDTWRFSAALAKFNPKLAKDNIRAMFDYQQPDGMIIDCIYTDPAENNARDSKPPLVSWAVDEIFTHTNDTAFISEMYPQLMAYYNGGTTSVTITATVCVNTVPPMVHWKRQHGKAAWITPSVSMMPRC